MKRLNATYPVHPLHAAAQAKAVPAGTARATVAGAARVAAPAAAHATMSAPTAPPHTPAKAPTTASPSLSARRNTRARRIVGILGVIALVLGIGGWTLQLTGGLLARSAMTNIFLWGLMIALFAFMVGFGAGCQLVASLVYLLRKDELLPLARIAAACGLACVGAAGVAIIADLGAARNIMAMLIGLNLRSPLAWDMIALSTFIVVSLVQLILIARDATSARGWAVAAGVFAIALQVVEGLLFATQTAHAWWATPLMPVDFLVVALMSGSALMLFIAGVQGSSRTAISWLSRLCAGAIAVHLVLALCDLVLVAFEGTPQAVGVLSALQSHLGLYLCELILPAIALIILLVTGKTERNEKAQRADVAQTTRAARTACVAALLAICGIFAHRLMLLYPAYNAPSLYLTLSGTDAITGAYPISTGRYLDWDQTFALTSAYVPAGAEWLAALLPIGFALIASLVLLWLMKKLKPQRH